MNTYQWAGAIAADCALRHALRPRHRQMDAQSRQRVAAVLSRMLTMHSANRATHGPPPTTRNPCIAYEGIRKWKRGGCGGDGRLPHGGRPDRARQFRVDARSTRNAAMPRSDRRESLAMRGHSSTFGNSIFPDVRSVGSSSRPSESDGGHLGNSFVFSLRQRSGWPIHTCVFRVRTSMHRRSSSFRNRFKASSM